ncbi:hypothetical protein EI94DRAFT_1705062 [Lactarius quietus]|nr:hypothetical protein EI94DRAFT_1705062 [Lactarius quietus]
MSGATSMDIFSLLDAELSARSMWIPNIDSLEFINDPIECGLYQNEDSKQIRLPNVGPYALMLAHKNQVYLEYEHRLCNILDMLESMDTADEKESMEDRVLQDLIRINRLKGLEWSGQCSKCGVKGTIVNAESYFVMRHPRNPTLHAIYVTTLVMTRKRKNPVSSNKCQDTNEKADSEMAEDIQLSVSTPTHCTYHQVRGGPTCGNPLFDTVTVNARTYTVPLRKYEMQDLKQWVG